MSVDGRARGCTDKEGHPGLAGIEASSWQSPRQRQLGRQAPCVSPVFVHRPPRAPSPFAGSSMHKRPTRHASGHPCVLLVSGGLWPALGPAPSPPPSRHRRTGTPHRGRCLARPLHPRLPRSGTPRTARASRRLPSAGRRRSPRVWNPVERAPNLQRGCLVPRGQRSSPPEQPGRLRS